MPNPTEPADLEPYRTLRKLWTGSTALRECKHLQDIHNVTPSSTEGCTDCLKTGDKWLHLRICLICGYVGCCDLAKNHHMRNHYEETGHSVIQSFEPEEDWIWCYEDESLHAPPEGIEAHWLKRTA